MSRYRLIINKVNAVSDILYFEIPDDPGTYKLKFNPKDGGNPPEGGTVVVGNRENTYRISARLTNGTVINTDTFTTQAKYAITIENTLWGKAYNGAIEIKSGDKVVSGSVLTITPTVVAGYTTTASSSTGTITNNQLTVDGKETITFNRVANTYTIKFNGNGATSGSMSNLSMTYGTAKTLTANTFSRTGHTFLGWSTSSTATTATYTNGQSVNNLTTINGATINLYAVWKVNSYTIDYPVKPSPQVVSYTIYCLNSPSGKTPIGTIINSPSSGGTVTVYYGDELTIRATAASGYTTPAYGFMYDLDKGGDSTITVGQDPYIEDLIAFVNPGVIKTYTVTFNLNGGTSSNIPTNKVVSHGTVLDMREYSSPTRASDNTYNYNFEYWDDDSGNSYQTTFTITNNITLTARYQRTQYATVTNTYDINTSKTFTPGTSKADAKGISVSVPGLRKNIDTSLYDFHGTIYMDPLSGASGEQVHYNIGTAENPKYTTNSYSGSSSNKYYPDAKLGYTITINSNSVSVTAYADSFTDYNWAWSEGAQYAARSCTFNFGSIKQTYIPTNNNGIV